MAVGARPDLERFTVQTLERAFAQRLRETTRALSRARHLQFDAAFAVSSIRFVSYRPCANRFEECVATILKITKKMWAERELHAVRNRCARQFASYGITGQFQRSLAPVPSIKRGGLCQSSLEVSPC